MVVKDSCKIETDCKKKDKNYIYMDRQLASATLIPPMLSLLNDKTEFGYHDTTNDIYDLYNDGYKYCASGLSSTNLISMLDFYEEHPDAIMIAGSSSSNDKRLLNRKCRNIYRHPVPGTEIVTPLFEILKSVTLKPDKINKLYILQEPGDTYSESLTEVVIDNMPDNVEYEILPMGSIQNIDMNLEKIMESNEVMSLVAIVSSELSRYFHNTLGEKYNYKGYFVENVGEPPLLNSRLSKKYYFIRNESIYERNIAKIINNIGESRTNVSIMDCINMMKSFNKYGNYNKVIGSNGYLYFNEVGDREFIYYVGYEFDNSDWKIVYQNYDTNGVNFSLERYETGYEMKDSMLYMYNHRECIDSKICFILQDVFVDNDIRKNVELLEVKYKIFSIDNKGIDFLEQLYKRGYRIFIGGNITETLLKFKEFFDIHRDCVLISLYSTADVLNERRNINIYRVLPPDAVSYQYYIDLLKETQATQINFIVQTGDTYSESLYQNLSKNLNNTQRYDVTLESSKEIYDRIINETNILGNATIICSSRHEIYEQIYTRLDNNDGIYINGGSTTLTASRYMSPTARNCYYLIFSPPYERNINALRKIMGYDTALPLIDGINMAEHLREKGTIDEMIGSYGYSYYTHNCDRNFIFYGVYKYNNGEWIPVTIYNVFKNIPFKSTKKLEI